MIRLFHHYVNRHVVLQMLFDFGFVWLAMLAIAIAHVKNPEVFVSLTTTHGLSLATGTFLINIWSGFYQTSPSRPLYQSVARAALALLLVTPLAYWIFSLVPVESADLMAYSAMSVVLVVIVHRVYAAHSGWHTMARTRILVLGAGPVAQRVSDTLRASDRYTEIVGYFPSPNERERRVPESEIIRSTRSLAATAVSVGADEIVVAITERRGGSMSLRDLLECKTHGIRVSDISTHFEKTLGQIALDYVNASWLIFGDGFNQGVVRTAMKRISDVLCALVLLIASAPIMLVTMLLIAIDSPGPIFYRQQRVGLNGKPFDVLKFRSMRVDAEKDGKARWASAADDRITRIGHLIRLVRIDELPQLYNVLKGEMSLVGPRPERPFFVDTLTKDIPYYAVRHSVKPGITGWAQVRYAYGGSFEHAQQKLQYDLYYVKNHTLFLDLLIMFETVSVVLTGKGAR